MDSNANKTSLVANECDIQIFIQNSNGSKQDLYFDQIVGALQQIVLEPSFTNLQQKFMRHHCLIFQPKQQNKLEYTQVFKQYQQIIQKYIIENLTLRVEGFTMDIFSNLLATRMDQIDQELLEMLNSFTQFQVFKELMLEYKKCYEGDKYIGLSLKGAVCKFSKQ